jgi:flagellar assembly factor FliW
MQFESTRFGVVETRDEAILTFSESLPGLPGQRWALLGQSEDSPFFWLHSVERSDLALPVTNPWLFFGDYEVRVPDEDVRRLGLDSADDALILCVVRASEHLAEFTINLAGPIVVHKATLSGRQIINDAGGYSVRQPLFAEVQLNDVLSAPSTVPVQTITAA